MLMLYLFPLTFDCIHKINILHHGVAIKHLLLFTQHYELV